MNAVEIEEAIREGTITAFRYDPNTASLTKTGNDP